MGLNVYAGTLTRYYCNNWKTAVQQWAEANGHEFRRVSPDGKEIVQERLTPEEIDSNQRVLEDWRDSVLSVISKASNLDSKSYIQMQMNDGDIQTAVVVSTDPLLVACRSEDLDAVILQCYPTALGQARGWEEGTKLVICCTYNGYGPLRRNKDIDRSPRANPKFKSFGPVVADLYAADTAYLERKKKEIPKEMWQITWKMGKDYMAAHPGMARNGLALSFRDAEPIEKIRFNPKADLGV